VTSVILANMSKTSLCYFCVATFSQVLSEVTFMITGHGYERLHGHCITGGNAGTLVTTVLRA
jgi:hypothetical protein